VPDQLLVAHHGHLAQGAAAVVNRPLPAQPTALVDQLDVAVTLRGVPLGRIARHSAQAMLIYKQVIGHSLHARTLSAQTVEVTVGCKVLNTMTGPGMPTIRKVA
jgi:hypothetical protein